MIFPLHFQQVSHVGGERPPSTFKDRRHQSDQHHHHHDGALGTAPERRRRPRGRGGGGGCSAAMSGRGGRPQGRGGGGGFGGSSSGHKTSSSSPGSRGSSPSSSRNPSSRHSGGGGKGGSSSLSPRGRGQRGRPPKFHQQLSRSSAGSSSSSSSSPAKRHLALEDGGGEGGSRKVSSSSSSSSSSHGEKRSKKHRRPKFQDNPPAPEIVEVDKKRQQQQRQSPASSSSSSAASPALSKEKEQARGEMIQVKKSPLPVCDTSATGGNSSSSSADSNKATAAASSSNGHATTDGEEDEVGALSTATASAESSSVRGRKRGLVGEGKGERTEDKETKGRREQGEEESVPKRAKVEGADKGEKEEASSSSSADAAAAPATTKAKSVKEEVSGLVGDMVRKLDNSGSEKAAGGLPDAAETSSPSSVSNGGDHPSATEEDRVVKNGEVASSPPSSSSAKKTAAASNSAAEASLKLMRANLCKAVKDNSDDGGGGDVRVRLREAVKTAAKGSSNSSSSSSSSSVPCPPTREEVKTLLTEFFSGKEAPKNLIKGEDEKAMQKERESVVQEILAAVYDVRSIGESSSPVKANGSAAVSEPAAPSLASPRKGPPPPSSSSVTASPAETSDEESSSKSKPNIDKSKLFSQMEDKFAKETHNALKNKPVYKKKISDEAVARASCTKEESESSSSSKQVPEEDDGPPKIVAMMEPGEVVSEGSDKELSEKDLSSPPPLSAAVVKNEEVNSTPPKIFSSQDGSKAAAKAANSTAETKPESGSSNSSSDDSESKSAAPSLVAEKAANKLASMPGVLAASTAASGSNSNGAAAPGVGGSGSGGSELTKSLRKVRVNKRSRASSTSGGADGPSGDVAPLSSSVNLDPPTLEAEGERRSSAPTTPESPNSRIIRPKLLLSPKRHSLSEKHRLDGTETSQPLKIDIPDQPRHHSSASVSSSSSSYGRRNLLTTPGAMAAGSRHHRHHHYGTRKRHRVHMQPTILNPGDAFTTATAVLPDMTAMPTQSRLGGSVNGDLVSSSSGGGGQQPPLKTVIRLPKGGAGVGGGKGKKGKKFDEEHHHHHHGKKKQNHAAAVAATNAAAAAAAAASAAAAAVTPSTRNSKVSPVFRQAVKPTEGKVTRNGGGAAAGGGSVYDLVPEEVEDDNLNSFLGAAATLPSDPASVSAQLSLSAAGTGSGRTRTPDSQASLENNLAAEYVPLFLNVFFYFLHYRFFSFSRSMVVPEKASSFNIHPERCCSDTCHYCATRFGSLDTPLHVSQLKTAEVQRFAMEFASVSADACLCDKCYRFIDRKAKEMRAAKGSTSGAGRGGQGKEDKVKTCIVRSCNREVTSTITRKWLVRLRKKMGKKVSLNWDRVVKASAKATFSICHKHMSLANSFSICGLCGRKMALGSVVLISFSSEEIAELNASLRNDGIPSELHEQSLICKHCKTFCSIRLKYNDVDYLKANRPHKSFYKDYRKK